MRSLFWLTALVLLLPPASDGVPAPRVSAVETIISGRLLLQEVTGVCERSPDACAADREALLRYTRDAQAAAIASANWAAAQALSAAERGTLTFADLQPAWALADTRP